MGLVEERRVTRRISCQEMPYFFFHDGTKLCAMEFLSKSIVADEMDREGHTGRFAQVIELYDYSRN